jgi:predicted O-methyltransferase YrrM
MPSWGPEELVAPVKGEAAALSPAVPALIRRGRQPLVSPISPRAGRGRHPLLRPAARKALRQRMLLLRSAALDRLRQMTGASAEQLKGYRRELFASDLPDLLLARGAGSAFVQELPQGALLYLMVRALRPHRVVETGVRPGYSTAWLLAGLAANAVGELTSLGPGSSAGRPPAVHEVTVGQFVAPSLRARWTLVLGNTEEHLERILRDGPAVDLFFYDNGPERGRAWFELRSAWSSLAPRGVLLAHHVDANPVWAEFCRRQGVPLGLLDPGPPPMGALTMQGR